MLDYILFHEKPFQLFVEWLKENDIACETKSDDESYVIKVSDDLDETLLDQIDEKYEELMDMNQDIINAEEKESNAGYNMAGVTVTLKDGSISYADIDSELMARVISVISPEELSDIVTEIADAVENPQPKTFCQRMREQ
jgi:hypothetical protein